MRERHLDSAGGPLKCWNVCCVWYRVHRVPAWGETYLCVFVRVSMNVQASDHRVGRRSDGPSEGWPVPLILKTLNLPAVVTN